MLTTCATAAFIQYLSLLTIYLLFYHYNIETLQLKIHFLNVKILGQWFDAENITQEISQTRI